MDEVTVHKNMFERRISARYVRFNPRSWRTLGQICMRVEIYLCQVYQGKFLKLNLLDPTITIRCRVVDYSLIENLA